MRLSRIQKNFEALASEDPLWTVLSEKGKRGGGWDPDEFYQTGEDEIRDLHQRLAALGIPMRGATALDFGCGVGRLTFPLSRRFGHCIGIDISESMIRAAKENSGRGESCKFIVNTSDSLSCLESGSIDFAYSDIVFQHMPRRYMKGYFLEISRALRPGGHFAFQLPSHLNRASPQNAGAFRMARKRLHYATKNVAQLLGLAKPYFEMNPMPRRSVTDFCERRAGLNLKALWSHPGAGDSWHGYLYVFEKSLQRGEAS
ncbi:class I SAM-dependent methyltransferase [Pelagicoccus sp. SDUM812003]|uniref:class I SAM-dependent methyltransferase n=1 Tax=Pelagicoccus sp. SDUM812003 TaxID=3041267 RepID=UPI00280D511C|nr:class I SAM-dependent methyltransferase [Pelagicoccus sp. SDUM812003]MDQ8201382.1 class I SAM-dependent methyltransferase [Pelagicoccus sp. SDUM812003]